MASPKFIKLLDRLLAATKSGKVRWEQTVQEGVFRIILGEGLVRLESGDDEPYIVAYLLDNKGQIIDQVSADDEADEDGERNQMFRFLLDLYKNARQSAYKEVDDVVDSMLADLEEKESKASV